MAGLELLECNQNLKGVVHRVLLVVSLRYKLKWLGKLNSCKLCTVDCLCIVLANIIHNELLCAFNRKTKSLSCLTKISGTC